MDDVGALQWLAMVIRKVRRENTFTLMRARRRVSLADRVVTQRIDIAA